jgi:hypothetical protein
MAKSQSPLEAARRARRQVEELFGMPVESVSAISRVDDGNGGGWAVTLELLELARIPDTTSVLGSLRGGARRERRSARGEACPPLLAQPDRRAAGREAMSELQPRNSPGALRANNESLADILERVLDKGVVIAGDITVELLDIELLTLKLRLLIASADTARSMGIDWWEHDPRLSSSARDDALSRENEELRARLDRLERMLQSGGGGP